MYPGAPPPESVSQQALQVPNVVDAALGGINELPLSVSYLDALDSYGTVIQIFKLVKLHYIQFTPRQSSSGRAPRNTLGAFNGACEFT